MHSINFFLFTVKLPIRVRWRSAIVRLVYHGTNTEILCRRMDLPSLPF